MKKIAGTAFVATLVILASTGVAVAAQPGIFGKIYKISSDLSQSTPLSGAKVVIRNLMGRPKQTVRTMRNGTFFAPVLPGRYYYEVSKPGFKTFLSKRQWPPVVVRSGKRTERNGWLRRALGSGLQGKILVKGPGSLLKKRIAGAHITFRPTSGGKTFKCVSFKNGSYEIDLYRGLYFVTIERDGYDSYVSRPTFLRFAGNKGYTRKNFARGKISHGLRGRVYERRRKGKTARLLKGATVSCRMIDGSFQRATKSDGRGRFRQWLRPGKYRVTVHRQGYEIDTQRKRIFTVKHGAWSTTGLYTRRKPSPRFKFRMTRLGGYVFERSGPYTTDKILGRASGVELAFTHPSGKVVRKTVSGGAGAYSIVLPHGKYRVDLRGGGFIAMKPFNYSLNVRGPKQRRDYYVVKDIRPGLK